MGIEIKKRGRAGSKYDRLGTNAFRTSTAPSTALVPLGVIGLRTTSTATDTPVVYTLSRLPKKGDEFQLFADAIASSSMGPFHINAASGSFLGSSADEMLILAQPGAAALIRGYSSERWMVVSLSMQDSSGNITDST